ncbi:aromatic ring-hydroxylating oxygenase subunit alpha [Neosynechococcus sphagnicola]|uniref:aromatic ring-hydroxylating dioxygenase subunit alpha n=1 Tax=Neosynechococcus sphagnicola TaxID=1501145 RepID=UPI000689435C|nr:aromatic ring-hydroxylating dioxygenase subunit alpha [Neosynechococcus sphagnicola]
MLLKNFWYAVEFSSAIAAKPVQIKLMDYNFALYRDTQGQVVALKDQCAHRGAALSPGWVEDNCLRCPYHGWKYQSDGVCVEIPANQPGVPIPKRARVETYEVQEKYGYVWLFFGDLPAAERPPIPDFPQFADPKLRCVYGQYTWNAHYTRTFENTIDCSHTLFLHKRSIGVTNEARIEDFDVEMGEWGAKATLDINIRRLRGVWSWISRNNPETQRTYQFFLPNITFIGLKFGSFQLDTFIAHVPVDETTTITKWAFLRNFLTLPLMDGSTRKMGIKLFQEDGAVVKTQFPGPVPLDLQTELLAASDATILAYRKLLKKCQEQGWVIEPHPPMSVAENPAIKQLQELGS